MKWLKKLIHITFIKLPLFLIRFIFFFTVIGIILGFTAGIIIYKHFEKDLPKIKEINYKPQLTSKIYDVHGNLLATLHAEVNRTEIIPLYKIPPQMVYAVVSIEDSNFFHHHGIYFKGILRAALRNYLSGTIVQGASTITQQLARNLFLTFKRSWKRKIKEAILALKLERFYTKEEIIEMYLNQVYFGHGNYGIGSAAKFYFDKPVEKLNLVECALLAGMLKGPEAYSPIKHYERALNRRNLVLWRMYKLGFISQEIYEKAIQEPITLRKHQKETTYAPYFVDYVKKELLKNFSYDEIFYGGLQVHTSLDLNLQQLAEESLKNGEIFKDKPPEKFPYLQGAIVSIDPKTGYIKVMVGGRDYKISKFNRITQAKRQPGSAFKPFIYGTAINYGIPPNRIINDSEVEFINKWNNKLYKPQNYDKKFHGPVTLIEALAHSYNIAAIKLLNYIGIDRVVHFAYQAGIESELGLNLSLALGTSVVTPLELARAYCTFTNSGIRIKPIAITKIYDANGKLIFENSPEYREVLDPATCYVLINMMEKVVTEGSGWRARIKGWEVAGKTGTTNEYADAWFAGMVADLVTVVWVGNDDNISLGKKKSGGRVAAPIWGDFMRKAVKFLHTKKFPLPQNVVFSTICKESGFIATSYCPRKEKQAFIKGTEPVIKCNLHSPTDFINFSQPDSQDYLYFEE